MRELTGVKRKQTSGEHVGALCLESGQRMRQAVFHTRMRGNGCAINQTGKKTQWLLRRSTLA